MISSFGPTVTTGSLMLDKNPLPIAAATGAGVVPLVDGAITSKVAGVVFAPPFSMNEIMSFLVTLPP